MGAVVVVIVALVILDGLDAARSTTVDSKARSVSATLAQDDQERLRSMKISDISNRRETRSVTVGGARYTVVSRADWVRDATGIVSCSNDSSPGDYLRISSTVTSPVTGSAPVAEVGLLSAPPGSFGTNYGTTAIKVTGSAGAPVAGATVALASSPSLSDTTNALGCAVFGNLVAGSYTAAVTSGTSVGVEGRSPTQVTAPVTAGATTVTEVIMDRAASVTIGFDTRVGNTVLPATSPMMSLGNSRLPSGSRTFGSPAADGTITADSVFPFSDGYGAYAGTCTANDPTQYDAAYFTTSPGLVTPAPGGSEQATARMPAINLLAKKDDGTTLANARIFVTTIDSGCSQTFPMQQATSSGAIPLPAYPFGNYRVCIDDSINRRASLTNVANTVANTNPAGSPLLVVTANNNGLCA